MQINSNNTANVPTAKPQKVQTPAKPFPGQEAFHQRLQDIQENRDLRAAFTERTASKGTFA